MTMSVKKMTGKATTEAIRAQAALFERYYGCVRKVGRPKPHEKSLIQRLVEHFNVSRSVVHRALANRPRSGRKAPIRIAPPSKRVDASSALAGGFAAMAATAKSAPSSRLGPEHVARAPLASHEPLAHAGRAATIELLDEALDALLALQPPIANDIRSLAKRLREAAK